MAASYKVPQDVEAEDKLLGPFSFRQFIYLGIVAMSIAAAWGLFLLLPPLAIIPLPLVVFFGLLALPLRKDQPMETYLAAMWQFYIKPRRRMWMADGVVSRITIDLPLVIERQLYKTITTDQAISQFDYLSQVADSGGWSTRGVMHAPQAVVDNTGEDIMDETSDVARNIDSRLQRVDDQRREDLLARIHSGSIVTEAPVQAPITTPAQIYQHPTQGQADAQPVYNPAPQYMQQHVLQPLDPNRALPQNPVRRPEADVAADALALAVPSPEQLQYPSQDEVTTDQQYIDPQADYAESDQPQIPQESSASVVTDAIMDLAKDVSVETVERQLHHDRSHEEVERESDGSVVINLH